MTGVIAVKRAERTTRMESEACMMTDWTEAGEKRALEAAESQIPLYAFAYVDRISL